MAQPASTPRRPGPFIARKPEPRVIAVASPVQPKPSPRPTLRRFLTLQIGRAPRVLLAAASALALLCVVGAGFALRDRTEPKPAVLATPTAIEMRIAELTARAQATGSILACLTASFGDVVDAACERKIFASPEAVAAASAFAADRLALLSDADAFSGPRSPLFERAVDGLRRTVERDRFGLLANLMTQQDGCTADRCDALAMLRNPAHVQTHLRARTFDTAVARHAEAWSPRPPAVSPSPGPAGPVAKDPAPAAQQVAAGPAAAPAAIATGKPLPPDYVLPSSESIPAISIMTPEPPRESARAAAVDDGGQAAAPPRRRERSAQVRTRSRDDAGAPLQLAQ